MCKTCIYSFEFIFAQFIFLRKWMLLTQLQADAPAAEILPVAQGEHSTALAVPAAMEYVPALHCLQSSELLKVILISVPVKILL
jgi:hypothetical protein